jgi:GNAT superfamily N-acetyltransferase
MGAADRRGHASTHRSTGRTPGGSPSSPDGLVLRRTIPGDIPAIIDLLRQTLGWETDERHHALFAWKHLENPFGASPSWVAVDEEGLVGVRIFMRWGFDLGDRSLHVVRAVDTATHPRAQGRGVFRALTMRGLEEMKVQGVDWVFNTPNDQSLPGYLSMGWQRVGRLPVALRPGRLGTIPRISSARVPADLWSVPTSAGEDAASVLSDEQDLAELLSSRRGFAADGVRTAASVDYLRWRYGASPVGYRALLAGPSLRDGVVFFRLRRRGSATEVAIGDVVAPALDPRQAGRLGRRVLQASKGDYAIVLGPARPRGWLRLPRRIGPLLTWRPLADVTAPPIERWELSAGDVELF